jgi:ribokinase
LVSDQAVVVWNPAPATFALEDMLEGLTGRKVSWITPNETEASTLTQRQVTDQKSALAAASDIRCRYPHAGVVITLGDRGAVAIAADGTVISASAFEVAAIDPTAAGDTFSAAFGVSLANSLTLHRALTLASAAGALATTRLGAVSSIPFLTEVLQFAGSQAE